MAACTTTLYFLLRLFFKTAFVPMAASLLFVVHPINTEVVCWISARKDLLAFFFLASSFLMFVKISDFRSPLARDRVLLMGSLLTALAAFLSKPSTFPLPAIIFLYLLIYRPTLSMGKKVFLPSLFALLLLPIGIRFLFLAESTELFTTSSLSGSILAMLQLVPATYLIHFLFPLNLTVSYAVDFPASVFPAIFWISFLFNSSVAILAAAFIARKAKLGMLLGTIVFLFLPIANFFPTKVTISDRYFFTIFPGVAALLVLGMEKFSGLMTEIFHCRERKGQFSIGLLIMLTLFFVPITLAQKTLWENSKSIITELNRLEPGNPLYLNSLGLEYFKEGDVIRAEALYRLVLQIEPRYYKAYFNLAALNFKKGRIAEALKQVNRALAIEPNYEQGLMLKKFLLARHLQ
jgi:hypothetical protein